MIDLQLTPEEAAVLFCILGSVSGNPSGYRGQAQAVHDRLAEMTGITSLYDILYPRVCSGTIAFNNPEDNDLYEVIDMNKLIGCFTEYSLIQTGPVNQGGSINNDRRLDELEDAIDSLQADMNNLRHIINF